jgi:hypothetical protein
MIGMFRKRMPLAGQREIADMLSLEIIRFAKENDGALPPVMVMFQMACVWFDMFEYRKTEEDVKNVVLSAMALTRATFNGPVDDPLGDEIEAMLNEGEKLAGGSVQADAVVSDEELVERLNRLKHGLAAKMSDR